MLGVLVTPEASLLDLLMAFFWCRHVILMVYGPCVDHNLFLYGHQSHWIWALPYGLILPPFTYCVLPHMTHSHVEYIPTFSAQAFRKKIFCLHFKVQLFIYLYLETKPIIIFQDIILHMDIIIAFESYTFNA